MPLVRPWLWILALAGLAGCAVAPAGPAGAAAPPPPATLAGTRWVGIVDDTTDSHHLPRLEFAAGGRVSGYTGCNTFSGNWSQGEDGVHLSSVAMTKRMCLGPGADIERRVLAVLGRESRASREGERLVLSAPSGERFVFAPAAAA